MTVCCVPKAYISCPILNQNFREAVEKEWRVAVSHRSKLDVSFKEPAARVEYPKHVNGWDVFADSSDCSVSQ